MAYDNITIGTILSEKELESRNVRVYNQSLIAKPTGNTAADGSPELEIFATYNALVGAENPNTTRIVAQALSNDGISQNTANISVIGNYATPTEFYIECQPGEVLSLARMNVLVRDSGSVDSGSYGNGITLTNGIKLFIDRNSVREYESPDSLAVRINPEWNYYAGVDATVSSYGGGNEVLNVRMTLQRFGGNLTLRPGERFGIIVEDNFSNLIDHKFIIQGIREVI